MVEPVIEKAKLFLHTLQSSSEISTIADDLLVFLYDLHDNYRIARSSGSRFSAKSFTFLNDLIYNLESKPDQTMRDDHSTRFIQSVLEDIVSRRLIITHK